MTACAPTDRLMQTLRVHVPGCTDPMLDLEIFNTMDEFFRRTNAWRHEDTVALEKGVSEYGYAVPSGATLVRMIGVSHNGLPVPAIGQSGSISSGTGRIDPALVFEDGDATYIPDAIDTTPELPTIFSWAVFRPDIITISVPAAELEQYPATVLMALTVSKECLQCDSCAEWATPEWIWDMFFQDILDGTLSRLYAMPSKPWSSEKHMMLHGKKFRNRMAQRKQEVPKGFIHGAPGLWRFPGTWSR